MARPVTILLVLVALAAAGCGGSGNGGGKAESPQDYSKDLAQTSATLQQSFSQLSAKQAGTSPKAVADRLTKGAAALDAAARRFRGITPPAKARDAHAKLVAGLTELAGIFRRGAAAARTNDSGKLATALRGLSTSAAVQKIAAAQQELQAAGIRAGG